MADIQTEIRGKQERVVAIEYQRGPRGRFVPFNVITEGIDHQGYQNHYDFEYCKGQGLYWHNSGSGPGDYFVVSGFCQREYKLYKAGRWFCRVMPYSAKLWVADGIKLVKYVQHVHRRKGGKDWSYRPCSEAEALKSGYLVIKQPLPLPISLGGYGDATGASGKDSTSVNPFDCSEESEGGFVYCQTCNAHYVDDRPCEHLTWCDQCACYVYQNHVREDDPNGKPTVHDKD